MNQKQHEIKQGRIAQVSGANFEDEIIQANTYYSRRRIAKVEKIPSGAKVVGKRNGKPIWQATHKTGCDFIGTYRGRAIAFEAKSTTNKTTFPLFVYKKKMVLDHQVQFLKEFADAGGRASIIMDIRGAGKVFNIPIRVYITLAERALEEQKRAIPIKWFKSRFEVPRTGYMVDYLNERGE